MQRYELTIAIPSFNSAEWLPSTFGSLERALMKCNLSVEVVLVDDGSTDATAEVMDDIAERFPVPVVLVSQNNAGVFAARKKAATVARAQSILFLDSRVLIADEALAHLSRFGAQGIGSPTRIGHVETDRQSKLVGRYWEVPTHVFWGRYLRDPQETLITSENFDSVPKGTGFLLADRREFLESCAALEGEHHRFVSDDTRLLRDMIGRHPAVLDPGFRAVYRPRTTVRRFLAHGYLRGTLFVDSYYGTSLVRTAILWAVTIGVPVAMILLISALATGNWLLAVSPLVIVVVLSTGILIIAAMNRAPLRALQSFIVYTLPFAFVFWAGLSRGMFFRLRRGSA